MMVDKSRPSIGRIYDYFLGGHHNFEVDREAAQQFLKYVPGAKKLAQLNRWFLQLVAQRWAEAGIEGVVDIASGLPTEGHFSEYLPAARILYSDNDPLSVAYGSEILKERPLHLYVEADIRQPQALATAAAKFLAGLHKLAVGFIGISYFLSDDVLRELAKCFYDLCPAGSPLAVTYVVRPSAKSAIAATEKAAQLYKTLTGVAPHVRSSQEFAALLAPWTLQEDRELADWLEIQVPDSEAERTTLGLQMRGALFIHP